jgi:hypothetical protein
MAMLISAADVTLRDGTKVRRATGHKYQSLRFYRPDGRRGQYDALKTRFICVKCRFFTDPQLQAMTQQEVILEAIRRQRP